jgi:hypothetical protein
VPLRRHVEGDCAGEPLLLVHQRVGGCCRALLRAVDAGEGFSTRCLKCPELLKGYLGESEAREALPKLKATFFQDTAEPFTPFFS